MEEMNATVLEVARNAQQAADVSHQAHQQAQEGSKIVTDAVKSIEAVHAQSIAIKEDMDVLGKQAEGIGQIMPMCQLHSRLRDFLRTPTIRGSVA